MTAPLSRFPLVQLRHLSAVPITNGLGEAGDPANHSAWPRYIRTTDIATVRALDHKKRVTLPPEIADGARVLRGDILMTSAGTVGKSYLHLTDEIACFAGYLSRLRVRSDRALPEFVAYWTESSHYTDQVQSGAVKSTIENFSAAKYRAMQIPVPSLQEQRAIADYLDRETAQIDAFIAKNEEIIALLTERRAAEIELAVAPRQLPATWDSVQIRRLGPESQSGVSVNGFSVPAEGDEIGVLKTGAVSKGFFDPAENKRVVAEDLGRVAAPVRGGSLIVNRANTPELVGSAGLVVESHPTLYLSDKLWQLTFESANAAYMHYWTKTDAYRSQLRGLSVGASSSMQNLSYKDFLLVRISVPPMREQGEVVARLNKAVGEINRAIDAARRGSDLARERRVALIGAAVTGKIDVGVKL